MKIEFALENAIIAECLFERQIRWGYTTKSSRKDVRDTLSVVGITQATTRETANIFTHKSPPTTHELCTHVRRPLNRQSTKHVSDSRVGALPTNFVHPSQNLVSNIQMPRTSRKLGSAKLLMQRTSTAYSPVRTGHGWTIANRIQPD